MRRYELSASQWRRIEGFLPGRPGSVGVTARDNRIFVNAVLWVLRSGAHWKDLPAEYGNWESVHKRLPLWARAGLWERIFQVLLDDSDNSYVMIDSTICVRFYSPAGGAVSWDASPTPSRGGGWVDSRIRWAISCREAICWRRGDK